MSIFKHALALARTMQPTILISVWMVKNIYSTIEY